MTFGRGGLGEGDRQTVGRGFENVLWGWIGMVCVLLGLAVSCIEHLDRVKDCLFRGTGRVI